MSTAFEETSLDDTSKNPLDVLRSSVVLSESWSPKNLENVNLENVLLCRISAHSSFETIPLRITHCLKIDKKLSWSLFVNEHNYEHMVEPASCIALKDVLL